MKIAVYAICGADEAKHVRRFYDSCQDADEVVIARTAWDFDTAMELLNLPARASGLYINIDPFRFDDARNAALALVTKDVDICVAMDMDEVLLPGWRTALEAAWVPGTTNAWINFDPGTSPPFMQNNRVHARAGFRWKHPCHEALVRSLAGKLSPVEVPDMVMRHLPDDSRPRPNYLNLLAWGQWEDPDSTRMIHYYGRELMFSGYYAEAAEWFDRYLAMEPSCPFPQEREATIAYLETCYQKLKEMKDADPRTYPVVGVVAGAPGP